MIRHTLPDFDIDLVIQEHLVTPTIVTTDGLLGRFDSLRVALEHLLTFGSLDTLLAIQAPGEELQFSDSALVALVEGFARWLEGAGLPPTTKERLGDRYD